MIYQPFEQLESLYLEYKLITSKNFIGIYFGHMVTISDLGAGPQSRPLPLVCHCSRSNFGGDSPGNSWDGSGQNYIQRT